MANPIEDFPVTIILALVGLAIGLLAPSPFHDFIVNFSFENVTQDPAGTLTGYVIGMPIAMVWEVFVKLITGLMFGLVAGVIGLFIDIIKNSEASTGL